MITTTTKPKTVSIDDVRVSILVSTPKDTPKEDPVYIVGNHPKLGEWKTRGLPLKKVNSQQYQISFIIPKGTRLEFKFTRGSWETVEKASDLHERDNRKFFVKRGGVCHCRVDNWGDMGMPKPRPRTWVGNIEEHTDFLASKLHNRRRIWVYLPPSYTTNKKKRYPVLYAHDGNNCFDCRTSFLGVEWELDDTAERLIREGRMREVIIVAVENTPQRESEYTHKYTQELGGGKADLYADFLINEVKPFIDSKYRTLRDRQYTGLVGSSLGGLVSLYIGWKYHDVFSMAGVVSPSIWWANRDILRYVEKTQKKPPIKIWLDIGTLEGKGSEIDGVPYAVKDVRDLRDILLKKGFSLNQDLKYYEAEGEGHNEAAWARRVDKILLYFFGAKKSWWRRIWKFR